MSAVSMGNGSSMDSAKVVYFDFSGRKEKVTFSLLYRYIFILYNSTPGSRTEKSVVCSTDMYDNFYTR